jgi:GntR family transcriptional regulator
MLERIDTWSPINFKAASRADPQEEQLLSVNVGLPLLLIHRTGWDNDDRPVEFTRSIFRGDRVSFIAHSTVPIN